MKRYSHLAGRLHCIECKASWFASWNMRAPRLICHECGGTAVPEGPIRSGVCRELAQDIEMDRLLTRAVVRTMN